MCTKVHIIFFASVYLNDKKKKECFKMTLQWTQAFSKTRLDSNSSILVGPRWGPMTSLVGMVPHESKWATYISWISCITLKQIDLSHWKVGHLSMSCKRVGGLDLALFKEGDRERLHFLIFAFLEKSKSGREKDTTSFPNDHIPHQSVPSEWLTLRIHERKDQNRTL